MRGWSVLGSVLLMGSGALVWSLLMARWIDSKAYLHDFPTEDTIRHTSKYITGLGTVGQGTSRYSR